MALSVALPLLVGLDAQRLAAMPPPTSEMVKQYKKDGSWEKRLATAKALGNHKADPALVQNAQRRLQKIADAQGVQLPMSTHYTPPLASRGMPTTGTPKMLILMIDFSDYPADSVNTVSAINARVFGDGDGVQAAPYESLKSYYYRSSYGQLAIQGNVLGWYRPSYTRASMAVSGSDYEQAVTRQTLIKEALQHYDGSGHDFSQYDNNGDGVIDYFAVIWAGPDTGWANFWWGYQTSWYNPAASVTLDGKTLGTYSWQWASNASQGDRNPPNYDPLTLIHETGHAMGLPDYYDYDNAVGPKGGVGGLDMMDAARGDHNCFSKFLFDWITPAVYTSSASGLSLLSSGDHKDSNSIIVMDSDPGGNFGEYFMVQNRQRVGNDAGAGYPADGLLIWHVDSRLNSGGTDFRYDNSWTDHKLLRLMEADGLEQIESGKSANAGDYWVSGKVFGPGTKPNSARYDGTITKLGVNNISAASASMTLDVFQVTDTTAPTGKPTKPAGTTTDDTVTFTWTAGNAIDLDSGIVSYHLQVGTTSGGSDVFNAPVGNFLTRTLTDMGDFDGVPLYARVAAVNGAGLNSAWSNSSDSVTVAYLSPFSNSVLDNTTCTFKTLGPWTTDTSEFYTGSSSARSAAIADDSRTYLQTRVTGPGTLDFYWKVSSEAPPSASEFYDNLAVSIDGSIKKQIGGEVSWTKETYAIPAGSHLVRWTYTKDANTVGGSDAGWVDFVTWTPITGATATILPESYTALINAVLPFTANVAGATSNSNVNWTITNSGGIFSPTQTASGVSTALTASSTPGTYTLTATPVETPNVPGSARLTLVAPASVDVDVTGSATTVLVNTPVTFTATVSLLTDKTVTWSKDGGSFGTQADTTIPWSSAIPGTFQITATSAIATSRSDSATVTAVDPAAILLSLDKPTAVSLPGASTTFTVTGDLGFGVNWSIAPTVTKLDNGLISTVTAPAAAPLTTATYTLTATHKLDSTKAVSAILSVKGMDLIADSTLDPRDLLGFAAEWGKGSSSPANFKGSGTVDGTDLTALLNQIQ